MEEQGIGFVGMTSSLSRSEGSEYPGVFDLQRTGVQEGHDSVMSPSPSLFASIQKDKEEKV